MRLYRNSVIDVTEEYASKTCMKCGYLNPKLGGSKYFKFPHWAYSIPMN